MKVLGVDLHRPSAGGLTWAASVAVVLWLLAMATPWAPSTALSSASILLAAFVGCMSSEVGIHVARGWRHLVVNVLACVLALVIFHAVASLVA